MKTALIVDFDARRVLFQKIVESLKLLRSREDWDLNWGEPFLAVSRDKKIWARIFYEETLPLSTEKLKHEIERLKPHVPAEGALCVCIPQGRELNLNELSDQSVRFWSYSSLENNSVFAHEIIQGEMPSGPVAMAIPAIRQSAKPKLDFQLSTDEVRELAEMGLTLKRLQRG